MKTENENPFCDGAKANQRPPLTDLDRVQKGRGGGGGREKGGKGGIQTAAKANPSTEEDGEGWCGAVGESE